MGGAVRWFKGLFGTKKSLLSSVVSDKGGGDSGYCSLSADTILFRTFLTDSEKEQNKHAVAVATATATAAEAAVSAAKAAAAVVRLTGEGRAGDIITRETRWAAVKIQKVFRGSLARKALRALKGIVKLQAIVRGYLVRKRAAAMLQRIQTLIRVQTAVRSKRNRRLNKEQKNMFQPRNSLDEVSHDERRQKISKSRQKHNAAAMSEYEDGFVYQANDLELNLPKEKWKFATAHNTPRLTSSSKCATAHNTPRLTSSSHHHAANSRYYYVTQSPGKSVCGNALCYGMSTPGYMENTQSSKAKLRSHSAPHQRSERKRLSLDEVIASRSSVSGESLLYQQQQRYSCS